MLHTSTVVRVALIVCRFSLIGWIGAAALFVSNSIRIVTSEQFDSRSIERLAAIRFQGYYTAGIALTLLACICLGVILVYAKPRRSIQTASGFTIAALVILLVDRTWIYQGLLEAMVPAGQQTSVRSERFQTLHEWSKWVNALQLICCFVAALCVQTSVRRLDLHTDHSHRVRQHKL